MMEDWITVTKPDLPPLEEYVEFLKKIWESKWLTNDGNLLRMFEEKLKEYLKVKYLATTCNGTLALHIALKALNLRGEVITTPFTFAATTNVIVWEGLTPVFADIDPETFNIDPADVEKRITEKTCAILAVHVFGNPCYVEELEKIAKEYDIKLIFDAAHAFGVEYKGTSVLNYGDISILSFHATKVFHTAEGGAIITKDKEIFEKIKLLRNHGIKSEEEVIFAGTNAKMNEFQAALGLCNLKYVDRNIQRRKKIYEIYKEKLRNFDVKFQKIIASKYNYSYMPIVFKNKEIRDKIYLKLQNNKIKSRKYFYPICPTFSYFKNNERIIKNLKELTNAKYIADRILCLPIYADLSINHVQRIISIIKNCMIL